MNSLRDCFCGILMGTDCDMASYFVHSRHAGVYTAEEVALITREKLIRLQSLYIDQFKRLQHLLKEKKRRYLHNRKVEHETLGKHSHDYKEAEHVFFCLLFCLTFFFSTRWRCLQNLILLITVILLFVFVGYRKQSVDRPWRSVNEGKGESKEAESFASISSTVWRGGSAAPTAEGEEAGSVRRSTTGVV